MFRSVSKPSDVRWDDLDALNYAGSIGRPAGGVVLHEGLSENAPRTVGSDARW
jgi:hypothetical protein